MIENRPVSEIPAYSAMTELVTVVSPAVTALLWKNIVDCSLPCTSTETSARICLSKPSVPT